MTRTYVVIGTGSGMGAATASMLRDRGHTVLGVVLRGADVLADLSQAEGRRAAARRILEATDGSVDGVITCAGLRDAWPTTVSGNFFGSVDLIGHLREALTRSTAPRVVLTSSLASVLPADPAIVDACLAHDETAACKAAEVSSPDVDGRARVYSSSKTA